MAASMTTAMTQAVDTPASATTALPALSSTESGAMTAPMWSIVVLLVGLAVTAGWALYARAVRVDRLHRQVLGARATLEAQLVHRAEAAADLEALKKDVSDLEIRTLLDGEYDEDDDDYDDSSDFSYDSDFSSEDYLDEPSPAPEPSKRFDTTAFAAVQWKPANTEPKVEPTPAPMNDSRRGRRRRDENSEAPSVADLLKNFNRNS